MRWFRGILILTVAGLLFLLFTGRSIAQEKLVMVGVVKSIEGRMVIDVENEKDKSLVSFRIGRRTVYTPRMYPVLGERVKVEYLPHRGSFVAYTVTILGVAGAQGSPKQETHFLTPLDHKRQGSFNWEASERVCNPSVKGIASRF